MKPIVFLILLAGAIAGCQQVAPEIAEQDLVLQGGIRGSRDRCVGLGDSEFTKHLKEPNARLAACPRGYDGMGLFVFETEASRIGETRRYVLFSVPKR